MGMSSKRNKHPTVSSHIINLINHYKIDLVLDVGANHGQFGVTLRNEGYKGEIHSFEPVSHSFVYLQKTCLDDEKWFAHKLAMGAADGKDVINVTEASDMSSLLDPNDFGQGEFEKINVVHREIVEVETIDGFLPEKITDFNKRRIFLKMDTQGCDLKVLEGSLNVALHKISGN